MFSLPPHFCCLKSLCFLLVLVEYCRQSALAHPGRSGAACIPVEEVPRSCHGRPSFRRRGLFLLRRSPRPVSRSSTSLFFLGPPPRPNLSWNQYLPQARSLPHNSAALFPRKMRPRGRSIFCLLLLSLQVKALSSILSRARA